MKYKGTTQDGIEVKFEIENDTLLNFEPKELERKLHGDALLARTNYQNLLRGMLYQVPTRIHDVYKELEELDIEPDISMPSM